MGILTRCQNCGGAVAVGRDQRGRQVSVCTSCKSRRLVADVAATARRSLPPPESLYWSDLS